MGYSAAKVTAGLQALVAGAGNGTTQNESKEQAQVRPYAADFKMRLTFARNGIARKILLIGACVLAVLLITAAILLHIHWPFSESAVRRELGEAASADVTFQHFHDRHFPPGCLAEGVVFQKKGARQPVLTIQRLRISSNIIGLFHHHVTLIRAEGMRLNWAGWRQTQDPPGSTPTIIDRLVADDAVLEIPRQSSEGPLRFVFHQFELENLRGPGQTSFQAVFENPLPRGLIRTSGRFGPWNPSRPSQTAVAGDYSLEHADMSVFHSVAGMLSSNGRFSGTFRQMYVDGHTETPQLTATHTHHGLPLKTDFSAFVDATRGDVILREVKAQFGKDDLEIHGSIAREKNTQRVAVLDIRCDRGRVEDTFYLFIHSPRAALTGNIQFRMHLTIPGGSEPFEKRVGLDSDFGIDNAQFTHRETQVRLSEVAESPGQNRPDPDVPARLQGTVSLHGGVARFANLSIEDQGAAAHFHGRYDITDERVDLHGQLKTEASLSKTTHGIKAVFAKVLEPFFKKRPHVTVVPVHIGGTYSHPAFGLDTT
jgi:AsmA-like C-terminal region